jgi:predicted transcriptional regulator
MPELIEEAALSHGLAKTTTKFKNRNRMEIAASLLSIARTGALKTHLMYRANLSYLMVSEYLNYLISAGLVEEKLDDESTTKIFQTTPKGFKFLEVYESLQEIAGIGVSKKEMKPSLGSIFS